MDMQSYAGHGADSDRDFVDLGSIVEDDTTLVGLADRKQIPESARCSLTARGTLSFRDRAAQTTMDSLSRRAFTHQFSPRSMPPRTATPSTSSRERIASNSRYAANQLDLLGATGDDGSLLVILESPDVAKLDAEPVEDAGELTAQCAVVTRAEPRVRDNAPIWSLTGAIRAPP